MSRAKLETLILLVAAAVPAPALAEEPEAARPALVASPERTARFEAQRKRATTPRRLVTAPKVAARRRVVGRLARFDDGTVLIGVPVSARQAKVLARLGAREVETERSIRSHCLCNGVYYRAYDASGLEAVRLRKYLGARVRLELVRTDDGRLRVAGIGAASP